MSEARLPRAPASRGDDAPPAGRLDGDVHVLPLRVYYEDTDASGIVYYANYLKFIERGRTDFLRLLDVSHSRMRDEHGLVFTVRRCEIDYIRPARLDDALEVCTRLLDLRGASMWAEQIVRRRGVELFRARVRIACITLDGRAARLPKAIAEILGALPRAVPLATN